MSRLVSEQEASLLALVGRRILKYRREAEARGEAYHDVYPLTMLACGLRAKITFEPAPQGYEACVTLLEDARFTPEEYQQAASELLGHPARQARQEKNRLHFVRT